MYVYQQDQGNQQTGNAAGALAALLPLGALALLVPLGLLAFGAIFPTTTVVGRLAAIQKGFKFTWNNNVLYFSLGGRDQQTCTMQQFRINKP